ncbi:hypothetical protein TNIN_180281 [Trichonephila inaurata madagascariensis]|uniref:Uncharacterized protein n=1 Tax=Trichonephila inaurata madagascariensis TaxID=2747483 RepID=A0A8X7BVL5_9ARAC|nr:hypothetical protein TNIN_180281 [Trichonephila inaurata madagascariensis]
MDKEGACSNSGEKREDVKPKVALRESTNLGIESLDADRERHASIYRDLRAQIESYNFIPEQRKMEG